LKKHIHSILKITGLFILLLFSESLVFCSKTQQSPPNIIFILAEDSYNIMPALFGDKYDKPIREAIVHHSINGAFAIRQGKWKLEICPGSGGWSIPPETAILENRPMTQLYDLSKDIREQYNVHDLYPDVVYRLTKLLEVYVERGRSTPGLSQKNDGNPDIWRPLAVRMKGTKN